MATLSITAASVQPGTSTTDTTGVGTAGGTVTAGMPVYIDTADSNELKACDNTAAASSVVAGIALHGASDGQPLKYQKTGAMNIGATTVKGTTYFAAQSGLLGDDSEIISTEYVSVVCVATDTAGNIKLGILNSGVAK